MTVEVRDLRGQTIPMVSVDAVSLQFDGVARDEARKYARVWGVREYRLKCHSDVLWRDHRDLFPDQIESVIDIGCGLGRLIARLNGEGIDACGVDLVPEASLEPEVYDAYGDQVYAACLWEFDPGRVFDLGICCDLMEHIPETYVNDVLRRIATYCRGAIFKIANFPSRSLGEELHLTRQDGDWWEDAFIAAMGAPVRRVPFVSGKTEYVFQWGGACA